MSSATSSEIPRSDMPPSSRARSSSIRSGARLELIACRSRSASAGVKPAQSIAICIICSWNSGTPSVLPSAWCIDSCGRYGSSSPWRRRMYGCTEPPWIGPGLISATSTTRS